MTDVLQWVMFTTILWVMVCITLFYVTKNVGVSIAVGLGIIILYIFSPRPRALNRYTLLKK